jgi:hypothetical protein
MQIYSYSSGETPIFCHETPFNPSMHIRLARNIYTKRSFL